MPAKTIGTIVFFNLFTSIVMPPHLAHLYESGLTQHVIRMTGNAVISKHARHQEIKNHAKQPAPSTTWRALDDSHWEFPASCKELIRCNPNTGIGTKEVAQLSACLNNT